MTKRSSKKQFLLSVLSLLLCFSMLLGTTFAWFTDSVTSAGNIIKSGTLDVTLEWMEGNLNPADKDSAEWIDASSGAIFYSELWEPGYTEVKHIKIENEGSLALKYVLDIIPYDENGNVLSVDALEIDGVNLAKAIDVYYVDPAMQISDRNALDSMTPMCTLYDALVNLPSTGNGKLLSGELDTVTLALKMQESAGNEYQNKSIGASFAIRLMATQYTKEADSFDNTYDETSKWPIDTVVANDSVSSSVTTVDNKISADLNLASTSGKLSATLPEGVLLNDGASSVTLTLSDVEDSEANITLSETEATLSVDVHIEGISENNDKVIKVDLAELLPVGLNIGNYRFYHVENGMTVEMTLLEAGNTPVHNNYTYDPATGNVALYLKSFSEVAVVADTENAWEGNFDYSWYTNAVAPADSEATAEYVIANADQLAAFGAIVGGMNGQTKDSFEGKTVKLIADVNLGDKESENNPDLIFYPIGYYNSTKSYEKTSGGSVTSSVSSFEGTFDGNGHTISNFYQNTWEMFGDYNDGYSGTPNHYKDAMGLFGYVLNGTVKNLTVNNFSSDGEYTPTGVIAAYADGNSIFENIAITNCNPRVYNTGNGGIIGIAGDTNAANDDHITLKNITVDNTNKITALWGSWDVACGGLVGMYRGNVDGSGNATGDTISFENCHVSAQIDVYNDVCANYQYYAYRYSGMIIGSVRHNTTNSEGKTIPNMAGISAKGCTVHFGTWNDYYYCEIVDNTTASYTHDYQMSRLVEIKAIDGTTITYLDGTTGTVPASGRANYVIVDYTKGHGTKNATCYHFKDGNVWTHDMGGIQTGIDENGDGQDDLREDKQHLYLEFNNLFTGYGWGVSSMGIDKWNGITKLDVVAGEQEESVVKFKTKFTGEFLYRVGNQNTVSIGSLFEALTEDKDGNKININSSGVWVTVEKVDENSTVSGTFTANTDNWTEGTIKFGGTGVVKVTIQDYNFCKPTELYLEVVDAYNRTTASFSGNSVLLNDVSVSTTLGTSGVIYGNGFTVNMENAPISEKNGAVFHLYDGTVLKNLNIVGKEFTTVSMNVNDTNYGVSTVRAWGTVIIENCYISGCRSAVSVTGSELTIKDSVIANGVYANIDFRSGILNLHNVTTINEPHNVNGTTVVGLGIVGNMTASAGRQINITGTLTQYNWVSKTDCSNIKATGVDGIFNSVFTDDKYANLRYSYNETPYVNTGILSLCNDFTDNAVSGIPTNYNGMDVTATISGISVNGYVWAPAKASSLTSEDMKYHDKTLDPIIGEQGTSYIPAAFNFEDSGLDVEDGVVRISYESGSNFTLSNETLKALISAKKYNQDLSYKIKMNGTDYTGKDISFNETASKTYTIIYTITDNLIYDKDGKLTGKTYEVTKELKVFATVVDKKADAPTFTFYYGTNGKASAGSPHTTQPTSSYTSTIKQIGESYYIMPNVNATSANAIGSTTIDGTTVYYPIVDGINVRSGNSTDYDFTRYYPVFKAIKISDNGTEYTYSGTKEMPATVTWESATITGNGATALNDGFGLYNNQYLCKIQKKAGDTESGDNSVVKYSYVALDGNTYNYYVGYRFYDEDEGGVCVTPDTLVTLADGSQKRIDEVNYNDKLLVWNFYEGKYDVANAAIIFDHGADNNTVIKLSFSDGTTVKVVNIHQFFDADLNEFVTITEDSVNDYIGHKFAKSNENGFDLVELVDYSVSKEYVEAWGIMSAEHYNIIVENMLSADFELKDFDLFNYFEINDNMVFDEDKMQSDIEEYGLYTYEDFADYLTYEQFAAFNVKYFKIPVGKGLYTFEGILQLIDEYLK